MTDKEFKNMLTFKVGLAILDGGILRQAYVDEQPRDFLQGVACEWKPTCKAFCTCGREDCKGASLPMLATLMVMQ